MNRVFKSKYHLQQKPLGLMTYLIMGGISVIGLVGCIVARCSAMTYLFLGAFILQSLFFYINKKRPQFKLLEDSRLFVPGFIIDIQSVHTLRGCPDGRLEVLYTFKDLGERSYKMNIAEAEREDFIHSILVINPNMKLCLS